MWYEKQLVLVLELVSLLVQVEQPQQVYEVPKEQGKTWVVEEDIPVHVVQGVQEHMVRLLLRI